MVIAIVVCALLAVAGRATLTAQLSRLTAQTPLVDGRTLPQGLIWGTDAGYDPNTGTYLVVGGFGVIFGICTNGLGAPVSAPFIIANSAAYSHYPRVQYSPDVPNGAGGAGGFLVSWHQYVAEGTPDNYFVALASCVSQSRVTNPQLLAGGSAAYENSAAALAYSSTSRRFLAVWPTSDLSIQGRFVDTNGNPSGGQFPITNPSSSLFPSVAWNPTTDEFGVSYSGFNGAGAFAAFVRVKQDATLWNRTTFGFAQSVFVTDVAYNAATGHYVMGWSLGGGSRYADLDNQGNLTSSGLISAAIGGSTSFSLEYNGVSGTFLAVGHNHGGEPAPFDTLVLGAELNATGFPITGKTYLTSNGGAGSFYPRVFGQVGAPNWNVVFSIQHLVAYDQIISTTSTGGGPAGGSSSSSSSGGSTSSSGSSSSSSSGGSSSGGTTGGCTTPDPFVAIGGGHCVNGGWLPGPTPGPTGSSSSSSSSGGGSTSSSSSSGGGSSSGGSGGCTTPDPFVAIGGGHCVNGGWLPGPAPSGGSSSSSSSSSSGGGSTSSGGSSSGGGAGCTTSDPFVAIGGGHCVNGGWLPGPAPGGGSSSSSSSSSSSGGSSSGGTGGCTTPDPFVAIGGGVCVGGGWQPAASFCGGMPDPFTSIGGGVCINGGWRPRGGN